MRGMAVSLLIIGAVLIGNSTATPDGDDEDRHAAEIRVLQDRQSRERPSLAHRRRSLPSSSSSSSSNVSRSHVGNVCKDSYVLNGGAVRDPSDTFYTRGRYTKAPTTMTCNGKPVYIQNTSVPWYMYQPETEDYWWIASQTSMEGCKAIGFITSTYDCDCPGDCYPPSGCAGIGTWETATGTSTPDKECNEEDWCPTGIWMV
jgi:hypothetical protein